MVRVPHAAANEWRLRQVHRAPWNGTTDPNAIVSLRVFGEREKGIIMDSNASTLRTTEVACSHVLRFVSLHNRGRGVAVPCDVAGNVDLDSLAERLRDAYFYARSMVGREYSCPTVQHCV